MRRPWPWSAPAEPALPKHGERRPQTVLSAVLLFCCFAALTSPASAQLLKLTGDVPPPAAGTGADTLGMADALDRSIPELLARGKGPGFDAAAGLRRLARDLARAGEKGGASGSYRIIAARTIANNLPPLDDLLTRPGVDLAILEMAAASLSEESGLSARATAANPAELDRLLRDALAPLLDATGLPTAPYGWITDPPTTLDPSAAAPLAPQIDAWARIPGITPEAIAALQALDRALAEADRWAAYRRSAGTIRAEVRAAAAALPAPTAVPWLSPEARARLAVDFSEGAVSLSTGPSMEVGRAEMRRLGALREAITGVDRLPNDPAGKKLRTALNDFVRNRTADREAERRSLESFDRLLGHLLSRGDYGEARSLIRHLRPAWRALDKDCQTAEKALIEVLPKVIQFGDAMTDPGLLTAIAAHHRALEDLASLYRTSALLLIPRATAASPGLTPVDPKQPDPASPAPLGRDREPAAGWKPIADRLLKISQDLNKPDSHDAALEQFRAFSSRLTRFADLPGEAEFRSSSGGSYSPPGWGAVTGGRAAELPSAIAAARDAWLQNFAKSGSAADSARLELLEDLMRQLSAAAAVQALIQGVPPAPGRGRGVMEAWPGWELSSRAQTALIAPARDALIKATEQALTGADVPAAEGLAAILKASPALFLAGNLERKAVGLGLSAAPGPRDALAELACGAPLATDAWLLSQREELAHICRYLEEFTSPTTPSNPADPAAKPEAIRKSFLDFANSRARRVLDELDRLKQ